MNWEALIQGFVPAFVAEFGDKTQITVLLLCASVSGRIQLLQTGLMACLAFAFSCMLGAYAGGYLGVFASVSMLRAGAGICFLILGLLMIFLSPGAQSQAVDCSAFRSLRLPGIFSLFLMAELGDKSQLIVLTQAANHPWMYVGLGASLGMWVITLIAMMAGSALQGVTSRHQRELRLVSGILFVLSGLAYLF